MYIFHGYQDLNPTSLICVSEFQIDVSICVKTKRKKIVKLIVINIKFRIINT